MKFSPVRQAGGARFRRDSRLPISAHLGPDWGDCKFILQIKGSGEKGVMQESQPGLAQPVVGFTLVKDRTAAYCL